MTKEVRDQLQAALANQNAYDLYDALADNGFETAEVYACGMDVDSLSQHIRGLLAV